MDTLIFILLGLTSVLGLAFIVERGIALRWNKVIPPAIRSSVDSYNSPEELGYVQAACEQNPSTCGRLLMFATQHVDWPREETMQLLETRARHEVSQLERGIVVLEIIVGIAPLLGLVGTIFGLVILFGSMNSATAVDNAKFARGISDALYATLAGLVIAIPALICWSYYTKKIENLTVELETICDEFLRKHYHSEVARRARE